MNERLRLELAKEYYKLAPKACASLYALLITALYFYWGKIPTHILLVWAGVSFSVTTIFLIAVVLFRRYGTLNNARQWLRTYAYLVFIQDLPWGLTGPMSFMTDEHLYPMLTLFMLAGMAAGAIITRALVFKIYVITLFSLLTPVILALALQGTLMTNGMLALALIFLVFMLAVAKSYSASINRNILLWLNNEKLINDLQASHDQVETTNQELSREIDRRKRIELDLIEAKERAEKANQAKNQFLANVSHELRTPLNGIIGFSDLLLDERLAEKPKHYIHHISKSAKSLLRIVNDILDVTAIEAGHIRLHNEAFSLRIEMEELLEILAPLAGKKGLYLKLSMQEDMDDGLYGDINRLRQILENLLSNALKYTETGGVTLDIRQLEKAGEDVVLRFDVKDTGIGMDEKALHVVFDNFTRLETFETRKSEGAGLGLAIVKSLVQKMDGRLQVQSGPGEGSCFSVVLSFKRGSMDSPLQIRGQLECLSQDEWQTLHVLVVDDNEINRMVLTAFLSRIGIQYAEADNGRQALELVRRNSFNLILLDIQMPEISGIDVAERLRKELSNPPVLIAITAHAFSEHRQLILDAGFSDLLIKPITLNDLKVALTKAYYSTQRQRSAEQQLVSQ